MKSFNTFRVELSRLRQLYFSAKFATDEADLSISRKLTSKELNGNSKLYFNDIEEDVYLISSSIFALRHRLKNQLIRYLRELIFIRAISALEVFLVSSVEEIFLITKEPFKTNSNIEFLQAELLSAESLSDLFTKIISRDCRNLHSGGFYETKKYYMKTFGINLADCVPNLAQFEEYHDRRHLLVHRLGATDYVYRKKHNTNMKKITIEEDYLLSSFETLMAFGNKLNDKISSTYTVSSKREQNQDCAHLKVSLVFETDNSKTTVVPQFQFLVDDKLVFLRDIIQSCSYLDEHSLELDLKGASAIIRAYKRILKKSQKKGELTIVASEFRGPSKVKPCSLSNKEVEQIIASLPPKPWPKDVHKVIAAKLGFKKGEVYSAIHQTSGVAESE
ncbi:MAG: hypothetical protein C4555_05370 [Dehalococcoidia bacterium]|nr:MAG: hypothetical protein C4555_05370 [Dehalococcoidia bacterium]